MSENQQTDQTGEEVFDSLTGFDEIAIAQSFGHTISDLAGNDPSMFSRALIFVIKRRDGATDHDAREASLALTMKENNEFFAAPSAEEAGKDEPAEQPPESSPSSASSLGEAETSTSS